MVSARRLLVLGGSVIALAALARPAGSATIHVPDEEPTIQAGLDAAIPGDTVLVACGAYFETALVLESGVVLRSATGLPDCVTVDAQGLGRGLFGVQLDSSTRIEGFTFTGGYNDEGQDFGEQLTDPGTEGGDGQWEELAAWERDYGGGAGAYLILSQATFAACVFTGNEAIVHGGGVRCEGGSPVFDGCRFVGNVAGNQGGGLHVGRDTSPSVLGCEFAGNEARHGGAIYAARAPSVSCDSCSFRGNTAERNGGAFAGSFSSAQFTDCVFWSNSSSWRGGALALFATDASLTGCTISSNASPLASGILAHTSAVGITNGILSRQTGSPATHCPGGSVDLVCCDVFGNAQGDFVGCLAGQGGIAGNFSADPAFCDEGGGDLGLEAWSPCLPPNNGCGVRIGALGEGCLGTVAAHFDSDPPGRTLFRNAFTFVAPETLTWVPGTFHVLGTTSPQEPAPGVRYVFTGWSDGGAVVHTVTAPDVFATFVASFDQLHFLTMTATPGGAVLPGSDWFPAGSVLTIQAIPDPGYRFLGWAGTGDGSYTGPDSVATVTMVGPVTESAEFELITHPLTMVAEPGGSVTPDSGDYPEGAQVPIGAHADPGYSFTGWTGTGAGSYTGPDSLATVTMLGPIVQTAHFTFPPTFPLTMIAGAGGSVSPASGDYANGSVIEITATPEIGFMFVGWTGTGTGSYTGPDSVATVTMLGPITQEAAFVPVDSQPLTMIAGPGGTVQPPSGFYLYGSVVTITATPDSGSVFTGWFGEGSGSYTGLDPVATVTMLGPITQTASFNFSVVVTITTSPEGKPIVVDGVEYVSPEIFAWEYPSQHVVEVDSIIPGSSVDRERFTQWNDGVLDVLRVVNTPPTPATFTAEYVTDFWLAFQDPPEGHSLPGDGWHVTGSLVTIEAIPEAAGFRFDAWMGQGAGSYSGMDNPAVVTMNGPIVETPVFASIGYDFSISASSTDPFVNTAAPAGGLRNLYFWLSCADEGIAAFEGDVTSDLEVLSFTPSPNVFNVGGATDLLLAIGGCPPGSLSTFLIGSWQVIDTGGELCLTPSAANGLLAAVNCDANPVLVENPRVVGFSSGAQGPCLLDGNGCWAGAALVAGAEVEATPRPRAVEIRWRGLPAGAELVYQVYRSRSEEGPFRRVTRSPVSGAGELGYVDASSDGGVTYYYGIGARAPGAAEAFFGPVRVSTPEREVLVDGFTGVHPNPFRRTTTLRFTLARRGRARLSIYDVAGRLVRRLVDGPLEAGEYEIVWDGRTGGGKVAPAGVYFSRLSLAGLEKTRKIVLLGGRP